MKWTGGSGLRMGRRALWLVAPGIVLAWALTRAPLSEIGRTLGRLDAYRLGMLLALNSVILVLFGSRWRVILGALGWRVTWDGDGPLSTGGLRRQLLHSRLPIRGRASHDLLAVSKTAHPRSSVHGLRRA